MIAKVQRGVTLVELIVTLAIVAIVVMAGLPMLGDFTRDSRIVSRTNDMVAVLNFARSEAVKRTEFISMCPSSDQATCTGGTDWTVGWIVWLDETGPGDGTVDSGETIIRVGGATQAMSISSGADSITYDSAGALTGAGVTITLRPDGCEANEQRQIDITLSGRPRASQVSC